MLAWLAIGNLGAAIPRAIRTNDPAEIAIYQAVALRVQQIKRDAK